MSQQTQQSQASEKWADVSNVTIVLLQFPPDPDAYPSAENNVGVQVVPSGDGDPQTYLLQSPNAANMTALMMLRDSGAACDLVTNGGNYIVSVTYPGESINDAPPSA